MRIFLFSGLDKEKFVIIIERWEKKMKKLTTKQKVAVGSVIASLGAIAIVSTVVPFSLDKKSENEIIEQIHESEFYSMLIDSQKASFDAGLKELKNSDYYRELKRKEKNELLMKYAESEETKKELSEIENKNPEDIQIPENGTEKEIKAAQDEKAYWEIVDSIKEELANNKSFSSKNKNVTAVSVDGVYSKLGEILFKVGFVKTEEIGGKIYLSKSSKILSVKTEGFVLAKTDYKTVLGMIEGNKIGEFQDCIKENTKENSEFFNENEYFIYGGFSNLEQKGYSVRVVNSWGIKEHNNPNYIVRATSRNDEIDIMLTFDKLMTTYEATHLNKLCPEFWNHLENKENQAKQMKATAFRFEDVDMTFGK